MTQLIPQKEPFVMIDRLIASGDQYSETEFLVREGHLFVAGGTFTEPGLIENMAQTAAAGMGQQQAAWDKPPQVGFIGQIKQLHINSLPAVGETITTRTEAVGSVMNVRLVSAEVTGAGGLIASGEFKIFLQSDEPAAG